MKINTRILEVVKTAWENTAPGENMEVVLKPGIPWRKKGFIKNPDTEIQVHEEFSVFFTKNGFHYGAPCSVVDEMEGHELIGGEGLTIENFVKEEGIRKEDIVAVVFSYSCHSRLKKPLFRTTIYIPEGVR